MRTPYSRIRSPKKSFTIKFILFIAWIGADVHAIATDRVIATPHYVSSKDNLPSID